MPLLAALQGRRRGKAAVAGRALGELGVAKATDPLIRWLERTRGEEFVEALGLLRAAQALDPLLDALRAMQRYRRPRLNSIADALARIGDPRAADALRPYLEHPTVSVSAAIALSRLGVDGTVEQIAASALDPLDLSWDVTSHGSWCFGSFHV